MKPLNGNKTHPLSAFALMELKRIAIKPIPRQEVNPGVSNRLERGGLVQTVLLPSPYISHKGKSIDHLQITDAGRAEVVK